MICFKISTLPNLNNLSWTTLANQTINCLAPPPLRLLSVKMSTHIQVLSQLSNLFHRHLRVKNSLLLKINLLKYYLRNVPTGKGSETLIQWLRPIFYLACLKDLSIARMRMMDRTVTQKIMKIEVVTLFSAEILRLILRSYQKPS